MYGFGAERELHEIIVSFALRKENKIQKNLLFCFASRILPVNSLCYFVAFPLWLGIFTLKLFRAICLTSLHGKLIYLLGDKVNWERNYTLKNHIVKWQPFDWQQSEQQQQNVCVCIHSMDPCPQYHTRFYCSSETESGKRKIFQFNLHSKIFNWIQCFFFVFLFFIFASMESHSVVIAFRRNVFYCPEQQRMNQCSTKPNRLESAAIQNKQSISIFPFMLKRSSHTCTEWQLANGLLLSVIKRLLSFFFSRSFSTWAHTIETLSFTFQIETITVFESWKWNHLRCQWMENKQKLLTSLWIKRIQWSFVSSREKKPYESHFRSLFFAIV